MASGFKRVFAAAVIGSGERHEIGGVFRLVVVPQRCGEFLAATIRARRWRR
jgi:hypothetical protein